MDEKMELEISLEERFNFIAIAKCSLNFMDEEKTKEEFVKFVTDIWERIEIGGKEQVRLGIALSMQDDLAKFMEKNGSR